MATTQSFTPIITKIAQTIGNNNNISQQHRQTQHQQALQQPYSLQEHLQRQQLQLRHIQQRQNYKHDNHVTNKRNDRENIRTIARWHQTSINTVDTDTTIVTTTRMRTRTTTATTISSTTDGTIDDNRKMKDENEQLMAMKNRISHLEKLNKQYKNWEQERRKLKQQLSELKLKLKEKDCKISQLSNKNNFAITAMDMLKTVFQENVGLNIDARKSSVDEGDVQLNGNGNGNGNINGNGNSNVITHEQSKVLEELKVMIDNNRCKKNKIEKWKISNIDNKIVGISPNIILNAINNFLVSDSNSIDYIDNKNNKFMKEYTIENCVIKALNGEMGIKANRNISKHCIIGRYIGKEMLNKEFEEKYNDDGLKYCDNQRYLFSIKFDPFDNINNSININDNDPPKKRRKLNNGGSISQCNNNSKVCQSESDENGNSNSNSNVNSDSDNDAIIESRKRELKEFVIEPHPNNRALTAKINDCRENIENLPNSSDLQRQNIEFVRADVNQWPMIFIISKKDILKDEQLFGYYGENYYQSMDAFQHRQNISNIVQQIQSLAPT